MAEGACQDQLSFPALQVTSSHVSIWCHLLASYDEYTALVEFGNVASVHRQVRNQCTPASAQCSAAEQQCRAAEQGWRFGDSSSCLDESSHWWVLARTHTVPWVARSRDQPVSGSSTHEIQKLFTRTRYLSFIGPGCEKVVFHESGQTTKNLGQSSGKDVIEYAESGCPIFRATTPLSRGQLKSKGHGKLSQHYAADQETIETFSHQCFFKPAQSLRSSRRDM